ncbi:uncharacterized protein LOC115999453 [Ipomoea triloba]|uniref:uncharacterized protein LOC115999453 n=1 Tax=Ipomoea triloba TaxID=35885 RepID=UPI00125D8F12|nr:uncharacterized protein LOC115999453 [Ipomoea triloba]
MQEYYPPSKAAKLKKQIQNFQQFGNEDIPEAWKRFKELRRQCPKNLMTPGDFISSFDEGLTNRSKIILDTSSFGGIFIDMGPATGKQLIERITSNNAYWYTEGDDIPKREKTAGMFEVGEKMAMQAQLDTIQHMLKQLVQGTTQSVQAVAQPPLIPQIPYVPNPYYCTTGNQVRNNPPGFQGNQGNRGGNQGAQWRNNQNNQNPNQGQFQQGNQNFGNTQGQGFSRPPQDVDMQTLMNLMMAQTTQINKLQAQVESLTAQQQGGGNQFSNQASSSNGRLPASTENPRHQVNAVTTRSGLALKDPPLPSNDLVPKRTDKKDEGTQVEDVLDDSEEEPVIQRDSAKGKAPVPDESTPSKKHERKNKKVDDSVIPCNLLPYPQRLWKSKESDRESKFHKMLDKLEISMPFVEAITQIPSYKKFLKNILVNKKKLEKSAVVDLSEGALTCAVLQHKLPPKLKDLGSFSIPCIIGGFVVGGALCDLGASVSLMPYSLCKRLNMGTPKPTSMTLQMADRSIKRPVGVLEDVPVMIDQYFSCLDSK